MTLIIRNLSLATLFALTLSSCSLIQSGYKHTSSNYDPNSPPTMNFGHSQTLTTQPSQAANSNPPARPTQPVSPIIIPNLEQPQQPEAEPINSHPQQPIDDTHENEEEENED